MKVRIELLNGKSFIVNLPANTLLTKNFKLGELAFNKALNKDGVNFILNADVDIWLAILQEFRLWYNEPMIPTSGYRPAEWNKIVGGVSNSLHIRNTAGDFKAIHLPDDRLMSCAYKLKQLCEKQDIVGEINFYETYMHLGVFAEKNGYKDFQCRDYRRPNGNKKFTLIKI